MPAVSAGDPVRLGIVGLGLAGGIMIPAIVASPHVQLVAAAEPNPLLRSRFTHDSKIDAYSDIDALIARSDVEAVYIATPHQLHRDHVVAAARRGKHIIVEKPMALRLDDCDQMIESAREHGVVLIVGHTHGFDPAVASIRSTTLDRSLGSLAMLSMWNYTDFLYRPRRPEELDTRLGGGILFNQVPHQVDIARAIAASEVRSVRACSSIMDPDRPTEGACTALLDFECGAVASVVYSGYDRFDSDELHDWIDSSGRRKTPAQGRSRQALKNGDVDEGRLRSEKYGYGGGFRDGPAQFQPHFGLVVATFERGDLRISGNGVTRYSDEGVHERVLPAGTAGRQRVFEELWAAVRSGHAPLHDGEFAKRTLATCLAILLSSRRRAEVQVAEIMQDRAPLELIAS